MNNQARRLAQGLAAARRTCALNNTPLGPDQFENVVDQIALACSENAFGPFNYDAFLAEAYKLPRDEVVADLTRQW